MENKEKNFVSAVIYVHNAADRIDSFLSAIIHTLEDNFEHSEIICVNDFSNDNSAEVIKKASNKAVSTNVSILNMSYFHGLETAMNAGRDLAIGDFVFEFDHSVMDFDVSEVMNIYFKSLKEGYDIVSASPDRKARFSSRLFYNVFNRLTDLSYDVEEENFRVLSRRVINRIDSVNKTIYYRKVAYAVSGLKSTIVKYTPIGNASAEREDKHEKRFRRELAINSLILFTNIGYKFSFSMTILMVMLSAFMSIYTLIVYITMKPVAGWTTTILFLSVAFFGLFGILTIVIKYLQLLVDLVAKKKHYSFESIVKLTK